jgi:hypothetical protein
MSRTLVAFAFAVALVGFARIARAQEDGASIVADIKAKADARKAADTAAAKATAAEARALKAKEDAEAAADWAAMTPAERTAAREQRRLNDALIEAAKQGATVKIEPAPQAPPAEGPTVGQRIGRALQAAGAKSTTSCSTNSAGTTTCYTH